MRLITACLLMIVMTVPNTGGTKLLDQKSWVPEHMIVPANIIRAANEFIISLVGEERFYAYFEIDTVASECRNGFPLLEGYEENYKNRPHCVLRYDFTIPELSLVVEDGIYLNLDLSGRIVGEPWGIPNCVQEPHECEFTVNDTVARRIATKHGFAKGLDDWSTHFRWRPPDGYVWHVTNVLEEDSCGGRGDALIIDANSGEVLGVSEWSWMY